MELTMDTIEFKAVSEPSSGDVTINDSVKVVNLPLGKRGHSEALPQVSCPLFLPTQTQSFSSLVILLFGLREQASFPSSAYRLASLLKKPIALFPIAKDTVNLLPALYNQIESGLQSSFIKNAFADVFVFSNGEHLQKIIDISSLPQYAHQVKLHALCEGAGVSEITEIANLVTPDTTTGKKNWAELINADM